MGLQHSLSWDAAEARRQRPAHPAAQGPYMSHRYLCGPNSAHAQARLCENSSLQSLCDNGANCVRRRWTESECLCVAVVDVLTAADSNY